MAESAERELQDNDRISPLRGVSQKGAENVSNDANERLVLAIERISKILGALYASQMGELDQGLKAERLSRCGFLNTEIADLRGTSSNTINVALHKTRRQKKKGRATSSKK